MPSFDITLLIDACGDFAVGKDKDDAIEKYEEQIQPLADAEGFRLVQLSVEAPMPTPIPVSVTIPCSDETVSVKVEE